MVVDVHCHVGQLLRARRTPPPFAFETGPWEAYLSRPLIERLPRPLLRQMLGVDLSVGVDTFNEAIERFLLRHILNTPSVDRVVALAFDAVHADDGRAMRRARSTGDAGTHLYVSNGYVLSLCRRYPRKIAFGASIHPYRLDAAAALEAVAEAGAVLVKWLPPVHNIDPLDPRTAAFLTHAARLGMPLLIHGGGELTLPSPRPDLADPRRLLEALRPLRRAGAMPPVIVAHAGTPTFQPFGRCRAFEAFVAALAGEFRDAPLYADIAALATPPRARWLKYLLARPDLHHKLIHGSDFPIFTFPILFPRRLWKEWRSILHCPSWIERDIRLKRAIGLPESVFTRFGDLAPRFTPLRDV